MNHHLKSINRSKSVDTGDTPKLESQQKVLVVLPCIPQVLSDEEEIRPEGPHHFCPVPEDGHGHGCSCLRAGGEAQFFELCLLYADIVVSVDPLAPEVLGPVCVLVVNDEQSEASVFVK